MLQVEIQGDWINVRDELAAFIVLKKNGWGVQKEQVRCARCVASRACVACELRRRQVWFASGNISGQFSKQPAFEGHSSQQQQPVLFLFDKPTPSAPHSISLQMTTMTMMAMTATMTMMTSRGRLLRVQHVSVNPLVACTGGCYNDTASITHKHLRGGSACSGHTAALNCSHSAFHFVCGLAHSLS
jgi:hypothetical protein